LTSRITRLNIRLIGGMQADITAHAFPAGIAKAHITRSGFHPTLYVIANAIFFGGLSAFPALIKTALSSFCK
jgi:hypothetical protein